MAQLFNGTKVISSRLYSFSTLFGTPLTVSTSTAPITIGEGPVSEERSSSLKSRSHAQGFGIQELSSNPESAPYGVVELWPMFL